MNTSNIKLSYGKGNLDLDLESALFNTHIFLPKDFPALENAGQVFANMAVDPIESPPLKSFSENDPNSKVVIVIADHTRPVPDKLLVPWIVKAMALRDEQVTLIIGTGSHRGSTQEELELMLGSEILNRFKVVNHNSKDSSSLKYFGKTTCGGPCLINLLWAEANVKIATGFIEPHFFAGYSAGPKSIIPGIAGLETILHFHRAKIIADPLSTWDTLEENPLQKLSRECVAMCPPDFIVNVTLNLHKEITNIFVGDMLAAHRVGCEQARKEACIQVPHTFPVVVTTNSGYPLDQNFYQAV